VNISPLAVFSVRGWRRAIQPAPAWAVFWDMLSPTRVKLGRSVIGREPADMIEL